MPWPFTRRNSRAAEPTHPKRPRNYGVSPWLNTPFAPPPQPPHPPPPANIPPAKAPQRSSQPSKRGLYPDDVDFTDLKAVSRDYEDPVYLSQQPWMPPPPPHYYHNSNITPPSHLFSDPRFFPQNWGGYYQYPYPYPYPQPAPGHGWVLPQPSQNHQVSQPYHTKPRRHTTPSSAHERDSSKNQPALPTGPPAPPGQTTLYRHPSAPSAAGFTPHHTGTSRPVLDHSPHTQITRQNTLQNRQRNNAEHAPHSQHPGNRPTAASAASRSGRLRVPAPEIPQGSAPRHTFLLDIITLPSGECMIQYNIAFSPDTARRLIGDPAIIADDVAATIQTDFSQNREGPLMREGALLMPSEKVDWSRRIVDPPVKRVALQLTTRRNTDPLMPVFNHYGLLTVLARDGEMVTVEDLFRSMREFFNIPISEKAFNVVGEPYRERAEANLNYRRSSTRFWPTPGDEWRVRDDDVRVGGPRIMDFFGYYHKFGGLSLGEEPFGTSKKPVLVLTLKAWDYGQGDEPIN